MKKYFFLSIVAVGAMFASCSKSEIVDSKFGNDEIGFQTYLGRDAQTKASVATSIGNAGAGIYGFYTGGSEWTTGSAANLWVNNVLSAAGTVDEPKYWTNASDFYTFLAYAPKGDANISEYPTGKDGENTVEVKNPTIKFGVPTELANQTDLLYAKVIDTHKPTVENGTVAMQFQHALSRLTVKAKSADNQAFEFRVKKISLNGGFITSDVLTLATGAWASNYVAVNPTTPATGTTPAVYPTTYTFYDNATNAVALTTAYTDYSGTTYGEDGKVSAYGNNYLMMIPVDFTSAAATMTVEYTTFYENQESSVNTATFSVNTKFEQGKAYAINLEFSKAVEGITFTVTVADWDETPASQNENIRG